jgi:hypothetical protein
MCGYREAHVRGGADLRRQPGPARRPDDSGALLIFDVDSEDDLESVLAEDPYYRAPGVTVASKRRWTPIVG